MEKTVTVTAKVFLSLALLLLVFDISAQDTTTQEIDALNKKAKEQYNTSFPNALTVARQAQVRSTQVNYRKGLIDAACTISLVQANTNNCKPAIDALSDLLPLAAASNDRFNKMTLYSALGQCWLLHGNYDSARLYHEKAIAEARDGQSVEHANQYLLYARICIKSGSTEMAMSQYRKALKIFETVNDKEGLASCKDLLGELYYAQRLYEKAILSLNQSYADFAATKSLRGEASALLHKGNAFYMMVKDDSAKLCYQDALKRCIQLGDSNGTAICYSNLSRVALDGGEPNEAIALAKKALNTIEPGNYISIEAGTYQQLGDIYGELKQYNKAVAYVQKALAAARNNNNKDIAMSCLKSLSELYQVMKQPELAFDNLLAAYRLKDSIQPLAFTRQLADMEATYESAKKETEIKLLKQQSQIDDLTMQTQEIRLRRQTYLLVMLFTLIIVGITAAYFYHARRKLLEQMKREKIIRETEEQERVRIAKDIHDELGSGLSKIKFLSELATTQLEGKQHLQTSLHSISETSVHLVENMRDLIWAMNPENTTLDNLVARIREYAHDYLEEFPIEIRFDIPEQIPDRRISKEVNRNLMMIVKEALQNVVKHSGAKRISIKIELEPKFSLTIEDDGSGFNTTIATEGNGLKNMAARGLQLGTKVKLHSTPGKGSKVDLELENIS